MQKEAEAIPWRLSSESTRVPIWVWETDHFSAIIQTDEHRMKFMWDVKDYATGHPSILAEGITGSFRDSEDYVKEIIGKSYKPNLGYLKYAGAQATTFRIFNDDRIDFGPLVSSNVTLLVRTVDHNQRVKDKRYIGRLGIEHYNIKISPEHGDTIIIPPSRIISVTREFGGPIEPVKKEDVLGKSLRIYEGTVKQGCTGKPGFMQNTVEHGLKAPKCPIHEV